MEEEIIQKLQRRMKINGFSIHTQKTYSMLIRGYINFLKQKNKPLIPPDTNIIEEYFYNQTEQGKSAKTRSLIKTAIIYLYRDILEIITIKEQLGFIRIRLESKEVMYLEKPQLEQYLKNIKNPTHLIIIKLMFKTGVRVSEASKITLTNIKEENIMGKGKKDRPLFITPEFKEELINYYNKYTKKGELLFPNMKERNIQRIVAMYSKKAGMGWVTPHIFRKTFQNLMGDLGYGVEKIAMWMGHSSLDTAFKHYIKRKQNTQDFGGL